MAGPTVKYLITHDRHIIDFDFLGHDRNLLEQQLLYPGSTIETVVDAKGARHGMILNVDGTVSIESDDYVLETIETRLEGIEMWAPPVYNAALRNSSSIGNTARVNRIHVQNSSKVIQGFVYNTVLVAHNAENRKDNAKWAILKNNMQSWIDIGNSMSAAESASLNGSIAAFFSVDSVYAFVNDNLIRGRSKNRGAAVDTIDTNLTSETAPVFGLAVSHAYVRRILEIPQE